MNTNNDDVLETLTQKNKEFSQKQKDELIKHVNGQNPKIAMLTCADSRVIPEFIFQADIGELFVVRVAGNIAVDETVIDSLEYAVDHLHVSHLIILAHTHCGAVKAAEETKNPDSLLLSEIQESFPLDKNHELANLHRQISLLPQRSQIIKKAIVNDSLTLVSALYHLKSGIVEFLE
jgi:carbonic anhydrase